MKKWFGALRSVIWLMLLTVVVACSTTPDMPESRGNSPAVLYITPAPTLDINATVTAYAEAVIPTGTPTGMYIIKAGDTLSGLAEEFEVTLDSLLEANQLKEDAVLQVGQTLIIPSLVNRTPMPAPTLGPNDADTPTPTIAPSATPEPVTPQPTATP